ncbi:metal-dependent hydrolase [Desulfovibrio sp. OttesenSCG-928-F07]|nr:metal-dependent hydrolase [Desulfovibrio sp. OttesenSCG-928-F07]
MDSVTHLAAGVLTPLAFRKAPRIAAVLLFGIAAGQLPDLDILAGSSAWAMLNFHRSMTHSIPALIIFAALITALLKFFLSHLRVREMTVRVESGQAIVNKPADWSFIEIFIVAFLGLSLHVYLDSMTTFGTQVLWPFSDYRIALPALFIVDFLFTVPLVLIMFYCLAGYRKPEKKEKQLKWARYALVWIILYPLCCLGINTGLNYKINRDSTEVGTAVEKVTLAPVLFSPFYWKAVAENTEEYRLDWLTLYNPLRKPEFLPPAYSKPDPQMWAALTTNIPVFKYFDNFASFVSVEKTAQTAEYTEYTFTDLRYLYSAFNFIMEKIDGNKGMFLMQIRVGTDNMVYAWRYLENGNDQSPMWQAVRVPVSVAAVQE